MRSSSLLTAACALAVLLASTAMGQSAPITLQGQLSGVPDGDEQLTLRIWDAPSTGALVAATPFTTRVEGGRFSATIDVPRMAFTHGPLWWSVLSATAETERLQLAAVPLAIAASQVSGASDSGFYRIESMADPSVGLRFRSGSFGNAQLSGDGFGGRLTLIGERTFLPRVVEAFTLPGGNTGQLQVRQFDGAGAATGQVSIRGDGLLSIEDAAGSPIIFASAGARLLWTPRLQITGGSDLAEPFPAAPASIQARPGMVLSIDPQNPGTLRVSTEPYDTKVAGVYSGANGLPTGMLMGKDGCELTKSGQDRLPLAMTGRVWVYADDSGGEIRPGDRLTTSGANPGFAARVADASRADGAVIGKAMTGIDESTGMVLVLVNLQ